MDTFKDRAFKLSLAVYRVTDLFPEGEILVSQMRQKANEIAAESDGGRNTERIQSLLVYCDIAERQNWVSGKNFEVLKREYGCLPDSGNNGAAKGNSQPAVSARPEKIAEKEEYSDRRKALMARQKEMLNVIKKHSFPAGVKVSDLTGFFPEVTRRTLTGDLSELHRGGFLKRMHNGRHTKYFLIKK